MKCGKRPGMLGLSRGKKTRKNPLQLPIVLQSQFLKTPGFLDFTPKYPEQKTHTWSMLLLNNPTKLNALSEDMAAEFAAAIRSQGTVLLIGVRTLPHILSAAPLTRYHPLFVWLRSCFHPENVFSAWFFLRGPSFWLGWRRPHYGRCILLYVVFFRSLEMWPRPCASRLGHSCIIIDITI